MGPRVIGVLRRFLPEYLRTRPSLTPVQWRAIRAITQCRTPALGGHYYACGPCKEEVFAFHSCNHKACPQCGREATREWVGRELAKRVNAPYFMVTFTLPSELRALFFGSCGIFGGEKGVKNGRMEGWKNTIKPCVHTTERCWDWKKDGRLRVWI